MNKRRKIAERWVAGVALLLVINIASFAQSIPDSILKNYPLPELGPNDTIKVEAAFYQNQIVPAQSLEWIWVQAKYPPHLLKRKGSLQPTQKCSICLLSLCKKGRSNFE